MATLGAAVAVLFRPPPPSPPPGADSIPAGIRPSSSAASSSAGFAVDSPKKFPLFSRSALGRHQLILQMAAAKKVCECHDLYEELVPYITAWKWQRETVDSMCAALTRGEEPISSVALLQHPPVYTMGTRSSDANLRFDKENPPFEIHRTERGGEVTYHGPGQLVMYPILNLRHHKMDLHWYLRALEEVVIRTLWSAFGLQASRIDGLTGVWVGGEKVAAIGVRVSRWISYHGLALNVNTDLAPFQNIIPCGIGDRPVGSIQQLLKTERNPEDLKISYRILNSSQQIENGSYRTRLTSRIPRTTKEAIWDDAMLLSHVHDLLLAEFAELFQLELVPPTREGPKTSGRTSSNQ
ncbi:unnamed protein product [Calypogeia fissa]